MIKRQRQRIINQARISEQVREKGEKKDIQGGALFHPVTNFLHVIQESECQKMIHHNASV